MVRTATIKGACDAAKLVVKGMYVAIGMRFATIKGACGAAELAVEGESMAVGMRAATIKGACGVAELTIKGESMAVGMRAASVKAACGVPDLAPRFQGLGQSACASLPSKGRVAWWSSWSRASPWRSTCAPLQSKERAARRFVKDEDELPLMQILTKLSQ